MRTNEDRAASYLLRSRHDPRLTRRSLDGLKGGETGNRPETGRVDQSSPKVEHENTPGLRRVTYQAYLVKVSLNLAGIQHFWELAGIQHFPASVSVARDPAHGGLNRAREAGHQKNQHSSFGPLAPPWRAAARDLVYQLGLVLIGYAVLFSL